MIDRHRQGGHRRRTRRWPLVVFGLPLAILAATVLLLTDGAPAANGEDAAPTARQAAAARAVLEQLRDATVGAGPAMVTAGPEQLAAVAAVASNALRPDRVGLEADEFGLHVTASRPLALGRWLNIRASLGAGGEGAPPVRVSVGSVTLPATLARLAMKAGVKVLRARGFEVPEPDAALRRLEVADGGVIAEIDLAGGGELARAAANVWRGRDDAGAAATYCRLAAGQRQAPAADFAALVRRAFAAPAGDDVAGANRDALVALAMLVVDRRVGLVAGVGPGAVSGCAGDGTGVMLHGRSDSAKHWLMSAVLATTAGGRVSQAAGEWKELADSVSDRREFSPGDASGFSLADIGADRAGELIALAAVDPARAAAIRAALARVGDEALMPRALLAMGDGIDAAEFSRRFGSTDDPRYARVRARIDAVIRAGTPAGVR